MKKILFISALLMISSLAPGQVRKISGQRQVDSLDVIQLTKGTAVSGQIMQFNGTQWTPWTAPYITTNFATGNLTATGDRFHNFSGYNMIISGSSWSLYGLASGTVGITSTGGNGFALKSTAVPSGGFDYLRTDSLTTDRTHQFPDTSGFLALSVNGVFANKKGAINIPIGNSGTVTNVSASGLSNLFTTSVSNPTTTPALSFAATSQPAFRVYASPNGVAGTPSWLQITGNYIQTGSIGWGSSGPLAAISSLSVVANNTTSTAAPTWVQAASDNTLLRRSGSALGFGTIGNSYISDLALSKITGVGVAGQIPVSNGTNLIMSDTLKGFVIGGGRENASPAPLTSLSSLPSFVGTFQNASDDPLGVSWSNVISVRHRNGGGADGNLYGMQIVSPMTGAGSPNIGRLFFRNNNSGVWGNWNEIATRSWVQSQGYLTSISETDPIYTADNLNIAKYRGNFDGANADTLNKAGWYDNGSGSPTGTNFPLVRAGFFKVTPYRGSAFDAVEQEQVTAVPFQGSENRKFFRTSWNGVFNPWREYAFQDWVQAQGYLTSIPSLQQVASVGNSYTGSIVAGNMSTMAGRLNSASGIALDGYINNNSPSYTTLRFGNQSVNIFGYLDGGGGGLTNSSPYTDGALHYLTGTGTSASINNYINGANKFIVSNDGTQTNGYARVGTNAGSMAYPFNVSDGAAAVDGWPGTAKVANFTGNVGIAGGLNLNSSSLAGNVWFGSNDNKSVGMTGGDINAPLPSGVYDGNAMTGAPVGGWFTFLNLRHQNTTNHYGAQLGIGDWTMGSNSVYWRTFNNGSPSSWHKVWSDVDFDPNSLPYTGQAVLTSGSAGKNTITHDDSRTFNHLPNSFPVTGVGGTWWDFKTSSILGLPTSSSTYATAESIVQWNPTGGGGGVHQIAYNDNLGMYYRYGAPNASSWNAWKKFAFTEDITLQAARNNNFAIYDETQGTSYSTAAFQIREGGALGGSATGMPHMAFHWSGLVASQIRMNGAGRIEIVNNPGTDYEDLAARAISASDKFRFESNGNYMAGGGAAQFLTSAGAAWPVKAGGLTVSDAYSDNAPANGILSKGPISLYRAANSGTNAATGLAFYQPSWNTWQMYMQSAGAGGSGVTGDITAPTGSYVTSWGLRSVVENYPGYGWTWESMTNNTSPALPALAAELSQDGTFRPYKGLAPLGSIYQFLANGWSTALSLQSGGAAVFNDKFGIGESGGSLYLSTSSTGTAGGSAIYSMVVQPTGEVTIGGSANQTAASGNDVTLRGSVLSANTTYIGDNNTSLSKGILNSLRIGSPSGYLDIGSMNSGFVHFQTDRPAYYFDHETNIDGTLKIYGTPTRLGANQLVVAGNGDFSGQLTVSNVPAFTSGTPYMTIWNGSTGRFEYGPMPGSGSNWWAYNSYPSGNWIYPGNADNGVPAGTQVQGLATSAVFDNSSTTYAVSDDDHTLLFNQNVNLELPNPEDFPNRQLRLRVRIGQSMIFTTYRIYDMGSSNSYLEFPQDPDCLKSCQRGQTVDIQSIRDENGVWRWMITMMG